MTKEQTIEWLKSEFVETTQRNTKGEEVELKVISGPLTQVIVHCIYIVLNTKERPRFGDDFSQTNPSGESLLNIVT
jgi:hypothetical protein